MQTLDLFTHAETEYRTRTPQEDGPAILPTPEQLREGIRQVLTARGPQPYQDLAYWVLSATEHYTARVPPCPNQYEARRLFEQTHRSMVDAGELRQDDRAWWDLADRATLHVFTVHLAKSEYGNEIMRQAAAELIQQHADLCADPTPHPETGKPCGGSTVCVHVREHAGWFLVFAPDPERPGELLTVGTANDQWRPHGKEKAWRDYWYSASVNTHPTIHRDEPATA